MDIDDGGTGTDRAGAVPGDPGPGSPQPAPGTSPSQPAPGVPQPGDTDLAAVVRSVDQGQVNEVLLTTLVGGTLCVGELVSGAQWWEAAAQQARSTGGDANAQFAQGADAISQLYRDAATTRSRPIGYLHMQNAVIEGYRQLGLWRIRLEEVQGWHWGP